MSRVFVFISSFSLNRFALQGNAFDLAIGIIIGNAFNNVVQSLVNDIITPPFGLIFDGVDFSNLTIKMRNFVHSDQPPVLIRYGRFIQTIIYLLIVAFVLFLIVKSINKLHRLAAMRKVEHQSTELEEPNEELQVLKDIRDLLAGRSAVRY
jgi:large conductance mechanosensitive channel